MDGTKTVARTDAEGGLAREIGAIRAFVFDLDGTLVEIKELKALSYASAAAEVLDESGMPLCGLVRAEPPQS